MNISLDEVFEEQPTEVPEPEHMVHNHDFDPSCEETKIGDRLVGACMKPDPKEEADDPLLNMNQLASHFGLKRYAVAEQMREVPPDETGPKGTKLYYLSTAQEVLERPKVQARATEKAEGQARKINAEAGLKELELERKRGDVVEVADVEQGATELFRALHNRLVQYADQSALDISKLVTRGDVVAYQKEHLGSILQDLRENPNNFITRYLDDEPTS
jgi:hypothetical protein